MTTEAASTATTQAPPQPTVTAKVTPKMPPGLYHTLVLKDENNYPLANYASEDAFTFIRKGGTAIWGLNSYKKLALYNPSADKGILYLLTDANAPFIPQKGITCSMTEDGTIHCEV
ncbi:hypothetical protein Neosp_001664 [[Neocosmospora] mangrovei]